MDVEILCQHLIQALETVYKITVSHEERLIAYQTLERFKQQSEFCAQCGLKLAGVKNPPEVRALGLQLMEHCVRESWNSLTIADKVFLKDNAMQLLAQDGLEEVLVKNGLSKIIVEIIKREWPQQWPDLVKELEALAARGPKQTEIVMLIWLRLSEDVVTIQTLSGQRRRDIYLALVQNMPQLFDLFKRSFSKYAGQPQPTVSVVNALAGFLDWAPIAVITCDDNILLDHLYRMIADPSLQSYTAECFLMLLQRKGKVEDRPPILMFFREDAMSVLLQAARSAFTGSSLEQYQSLKQLCKVFVALGTQLAAQWSSEDVKPPPTFTTFLEAVLEFTAHPSYAVSCLTTPLWYVLLRHPLISVNPVIVSFLPKFIPVVARKLIKGELPFKSTTSAGSDFSKFDFDSDEDFINSFQKQRAEMGEKVRLSTTIAPTVTFECGSKWLQLVLTDSSLDTADTAASAAEWDALAVFLDAVMSRLMTSPSPRPARQECVRVLEAVYLHQTTDPLILSSLLSCISALFPFISYAPQALAPLLDKIFSAVVFSVPGQTKSTRPRAVRNVRRHACSALVKICKLYQNLLLPSFDAFSRHVMELSKDPDVLSRLERCTLTEALLLLSNNLHDFEKQSRFVEQILSPVKTFWLSQELRTGLIRIESFLTFIGLDKEPVEPSPEDVSGINRSQIADGINMSLAVIKRSRWPENADILKEKGFTRQLGPSGTAVPINPATAHIIPLLENILYLARCVNMMWLPTAQTLVHPGYARANDITDGEKYQILGEMPPATVEDLYASRNPVERMQYFISGIHENCCHSIGEAASSLGHQFYYIPGLASAIVECYLTNFELLPDYRVRTLTRSMLKPLVLSCPPECQSTVLIPVLSVYCPMVYQKLQLKFEQMIQQVPNYQSSDKDSAESVEVVEEQLHKLLTKEHLDLISVILQGKKASPDQNADEMMEEEYGMEQQQEGMSELGKLMFKHEGLWRSVFLCLFSSLTWNSISCVKASQHIITFVQEMISAGLMGPQEASHVFASLLQGLHQHGEHEANMRSLIHVGVTVYEILRPSFPQLDDVMLQVPGVDLAHLHGFQYKLSGVNGRQADKRKRDLFKMLVGSIIGKSVGDMFKKEVYIRDLPPIVKPGRVKAIKVDEGDMGLCGLFVPEN